jgi:hypothetical protein
MSDCTCATDLLEEAARVIREADRLGRSRHPRERLAGKTLHAYATGYARAAGFIDRRKAD